jgi:periplasmic protein CpxP/Spy
MAPTRRKELQMTDQENHVVTSRPSRRKWFALAGVAAALGTAGAVAAQGFGPPGGGFGHGMMMMRGGPMGLDPAALADRADRGVRHLAVEVDATPEQTEKLRAIARDLVKDLAPLRGARKEAAERFRALVTRDTVDKADIEAFRADQIAKMDAASKRIAQAIADAAQVLTAEQRRKLADRMPGPGAGPFWRRG